MIANNAATIAAQQADEAGMALRPLVSPYMYGQSAPGGNMPIMPTAPPVDVQQYMPRPTTLTMPSIVGTATASIPEPERGLLPQDLLRPMPSIVTTAPAVMPPPCSGFVQWVSDNPFLAVAGLAALAWFTLARPKGQGQG